MLRTHAPILRILAVAAIILLPVVTILSTVPVPALAQSAIDVRVTDLERRTTINEAEDSAVRLDLGRLTERITRVEVIGQNNNTLLIGILLSVCGLWIDRVIRWGVGRRS